MIMDQIPWKIEIPNESYCPYCKENTIEIYDVDGRPRGYSQALERYKDNKQYLGTYYDTCELYAFMCTKCKRVFQINWFLKYPIPNTRGTI